MIARLPRRDTQHHIDSYPTLQAWYVANLQIPTRWEQIPNVARCSIGLRDFRRLE